MLFKVSDSLKAFCAEQKAKEQPKTLAETVANLVERVDVIEPIVLGTTGEGEAT